MKRSRRIKRMSKKRLKLSTKMNLTSLMDVFTILVFFLLVNSGTAETLETPKEIELPLSKVESKPRETVVIFVGREQIVVQGEPVALVADILESPGEDIEPIAARLALIKENIIGSKTLKVAQSQEVTILADKSVPFSVIKQIMSTCTSQGYGHISLAVMQRDAQITQI
ncbi:MAG: biopolymer transporter ExbD [Gammaproteobacteria bacterium]|nr:biopolymer transporter ExbD [Gammaproteobacteria bacterium]